MQKSTSNKSSASNKDPKISRTVLNDLKRGDIKRTLRQDLKDFYHFYLDDEKKAKLKEMSRIRRYFRMFLWLVKSLILKLTPGRRILLFISFILFLMPNTRMQNGNVQSDINFQVLGFFVLLFVLALELKDKLLAQDELQVGRKVQFALMPDKNPQVPGWEIWMYTHPANEVGGDLVDYLFINENQLGVALGDVAGKGLGAALLMAKLQASIRALTPIIRTFSDIGAQLNKIFCRDGLPNSFVSLIYFELEPHSGSVNILNAGHIPPLILKGNRVSEIERGAPALGIHQKSAYKKQTIDLQIGELMLVYSDGLTEARNEDGKFFGEQRLIQVFSNYQELSAAQAGKRLLAVVENFVGEARRNDDLSMILIKRVG